MIKEMIPLEDMDFMEIQFADVQSNFKTFM